MKEIFKRNLSFSLGLSTLALFFGFLGHTAYTSDKRQKESNEVASQIYNLASGEDKILDIKEKRTLLNKFGINSSIDENERFLIQGDDRGNIYFYLDYTEGARPVINYKTLGKISLDEGRKYIDSHKGL